MLDLAPQSTVPPAAVESPNGKTGDALDPGNGRTGSVDGTVARRGADSVAVAVLLVLIAVAAANRFAFDTWLARFDFYSFFVPWYAHLGERLRAFDIPGWNPHLFSGTHFAGDPESGWWYLPAMLAFTVFDVLTGFKAMAALHLAIAGISTYVLARVLGMRPPAALVAGVAYVVGPLLQWNTYCCLVLAQFAVWTPLALLGLELALRATRWRERIVPWAASAFAVSQMYGGWVGEGWLVAPLLVAAYVGYRVLLSPARSEGGPGSEPGLGPGLGLGLGLGQRLVVGAATGIAVLGFGVALGAAGILPRLDANAQSNLAGADYASMGAAGMLNRPWAPDYLLHQMLGGNWEQRRAALGGAVIVLALLAPVLARRRYAAPCFLGLTVIAVILTLDTTPLHQVLYLIPRFQSLHEHDAWRIYTVAIIGPAILAGAAVDALPRWRGRRRLLPLVPVPLLLIAIAAAAMAPSRGFIGWTTLVAAAGATLLVGLAVVIPRAEPGARHGAGTGLPPSTGSNGRAAPNARRGTPDAISRWLAPVALLLVFALPTGAELTGSWFGWPPNASWERHWRPGAFVAQSLANEVSPVDPFGAGEFLRQRLAADGPFRYVGYGGALFPGDPRRQDSYMGRRFEPAIQALLVNGRPMFLDLYETQGYNPVELQRYAEFMEAVNGTAQNYHLAYLLPGGTRSPLLDLLDVRYVLVDAAIPPDRADVAALRAGRREVFRTPLVVVYERDPVPAHAWIVHDVRAVERGEALPLLTGGTIDPRRTALIEGTPPPVSAPAAGAVESARVTRYEADALTIAASAAAPGLLVVSEMYEEGWRAYVDGQPTAIVPTDHVLRGIPLPAGEHTVELRYEPTSLRLGLAVSGVAAGVMLFGCAWASGPWSGGRPRMRAKPAPIKAARASTAAGRPQPKPSTINPQRSGPTSDAKRPEIA